MRQIASARVATCVVAAALVGTAGGLLPAEARAADGTVSAPDPQATMPSVDATMVSVDVPAGPVDNVVASALSATGITPSTAPEEEPASESTGADATEPVAPATAQADDGPVADSGVEPSQMPDTKPESSDTTPDTASPGTAAVAPGALPAAAAAAAVQTSATNVNVSVRIGSPGDAGPVTQVNVASAAVGGGSAESAPAAAPVAKPTGASAPPSAVSPSTPPPTSAAQDDAGVWSWQWDCLSAPDLTAISGAGSTGSSMPMSWTWIWNCGGNAGQYQGATSSQYQPSNVNVSIRISSPGNDGPVSQSNVAVAVALPAGVRSPQGPGIDPALFTGPAASLPAAVAISAISLPVASPSVVEAIVFAALPPSDEAGVAAITGALTDSLTESLAGSELDGLDAPVVPPSLVLRRPPSRDAVGGSGGWRLPVFGSPSASRLPGAVLGLNGSTSATSPATSAAPRTAPDVTSGADTRKTPAPRWKAPAPPQPVPATAPSGASIAPASGGGSSGGGIPIFLALPFLAAMLDLARRVTLESVALPSGHRSRMPDDPG